MTLKELRKAIKIWQPKLGLDNWTITVLIGKDEDMAGEEYIGHCFWKPEYAEATIMVRKGANLHVLVHEAVHLLLEGHLVQPKRYDPLYERAINILTEALIGEKEN